jgi:hypothetical protein
MSLIIVLIFCNYTTANSHNDTELTSNIRFAEQQNTGGSSVVVPLQGTFSVTPNGASTYNLPLDLPPAAAGLVPQLALAYNSAGGSGPLGFGWGITGLSAIVRGGRNLLHDGATDPITFINSFDSFWMDGQRLIKKYGGSYFVESDPSIIITLGNSGFSFIAKDGKTYEYSQLTRISIPKQYADIVRPKASSIDLQRDYEFIYSLTKVVDPKGNYIRYRYEQDSDGDLRISSIEYSGNGAGSAACKVAFSYISRPDVINSWIWGQQLRQKYLLSKISITDGNCVWCTYDFEYGSNTTYGSFLKKAKKSTGDGLQYPPILFSWNWEKRYSSQTEKSASLPYDSTPYSNKIGYDKGDFNGDGRMDMLVKEEGKEAAFYLANEAGLLIKSGVISIAEDVNVEALIPYFPTNANMHISNPPSRTSCSVGDFNGDGYTDVLLVIPSYTYEIEDGVTLPSRPDYEGKAGVDNCVSNGLRYEIYTYRSGSITPLLSWESPFESGFNNQPLIFDCDNDGICEFILPDNRVVKLNNGQLVTVKTLSRYIDRNIVIANYEGYADVKTYIKEKQLYELSADWTTSTP